MLKPFKTSLFAAVAGFAFAGAVPAQASCDDLCAAPVETVETAPVAAAAGPALWKVADEDTTIYLFGTIHVLPDGVSWMTPAINAALGSSDVLVTEILMTPEATVRSQQLVAELGTLPAGTTLRSLMTDEQKANYEAALAALGLPAATFDPYEPWFATLTLSILPLVKQGYKIDQGVEKVLETNAESNLARDALETIEFQLAIFDSAPMEAQLEYLAQAVDGVDEVAPMVDAMVAEWLEGDADGLAALMNEDLDKAPEVAEALLYNRNANWAQWIEERLATPGSVFMAVGAGHLAGTRSVQDLLGQRGIQVFRVQ